MGTLQFFGLRIAYHRDFLQLLFVPTNLIIPDFVGLCAYYMLMCLLDT